MPVGAGQANVVAYPTVLHGLSAANAKFDGKVDFLLIVVGLKNTILHMLSVAMEK